MMEELIIHITDEEKENWHSIIKERLGSLYNYDVVEKKLRECIEGWPRSPKTFEQRVNRKFFHKVTRAETIAVEPVEAEFDHPLFNQLTQQEVTFFKKRYNEYQSDFEFNSSSDRTLLLQLIFEEIVQARCLEGRLSKKQNDYQLQIEDQLNNSMDRLISLQKSLGITREKRKDELDNRGGDIATLSITLEQKLKDAAKMKIKDQEEESYYMNEKSKRPVVNVLPPLESLQNDVERINEIAIVDLGVEEIPKEEETTQEKEALPIGTEL